MDVKLLREATRLEHEATEANVPLMAQDLTREQYVAVLQRFYDVIRAWEAVAATEAPPALADLVQQRGRGGALKSDLDFFGALVPNEKSGAIEQQMCDLIGSGQDPEARSSRFLGLMYVVEGSTLGGQYIAKHVETLLQLEPGCGDRFFRGYGADTMPKWREFQQVLAGVPDMHAAGTIAAAKGMFHIFARRLSEPFIPTPERFVGKK